MGAILVLASVFTVIMLSCHVVAGNGEFGQMKHSMRQVTVVIPESLDYEMVFDDIFQKAANYVELAVKRLIWEVCLALSILVQLNILMTEKRIGRSPVDAKWEFRDCY